MNAHAMPQERSSWPFFWAIFVPLIGFVLGIIEATRGTMGRGAAIMALSLCGVVVWSAILPTI